MLVVRSQLPSYLGDFQIRQRLGVGAMAAVHRAWWNAERREVALKVLLPRHAGNPKLVHLFQQEAKYAQMVRHPRCVAGFDAGSDGVHHYLALELLEGLDIAAYQVQLGAPLGVEETLRIIAQAAEGCQALESRGLVHRDVKPANFFLTQDGGIKLGDFGLVCAVNDRVAQGGGDEPVGTPAFLSPEQAKGEAVDVRSDIYSLAASMFKMLSGRAVHVGTDRREILFKIIKEKATRLDEIREDVPPVLADFVAKCLTNDRDDRPAGMNVFLAGLHDVRHKLKHPVRPAKAPATCATVVSDKGAKRTSLIDKANAANVEESRINPEKLAILTKMVLIAEGGLSAYIKLAPGAHFARSLLDPVLKEAGVIFGLDDSAISEATRPAEVPRRITLAKGVPPLPGRPGRNVRGFAIPPREEAVQIEIVDGGMIAWAHLAPGSAPTPGDLATALRKAGVCHGIDKVAIARCGRPGAEEGPRSIAVATATDPVPGWPEGFRLLGEENPELGPGMRRVERGDIIARWEGARESRPGFNILGGVLYPDEPPALSEEAQAGEGTNPDMGPDGQALLMATRTGIAQAQADGRIRVMGALEVDGDLSADDAALDTDKLVLIRGNVRPGAKIRSAEDVVILGDCCNADVEAGGDLEVHGNMEPGDKAVLVAGQARAGGCVQRKVVAGSIRVSGGVRNAQLVATGDIMATEVIGGSLTAGGGVQVERAGDRNGTTTELWAGHMVRVAEAADLARLEQRRIGAELTRLRGESTQLIEEEDRLGRSALRMKESTYTDKRRLKMIVRRLRQVEGRMTELETNARDLRGQFTNENAKERDLLSRAHDTEVAVDVTKVAMPGVVAAVADVEPEVLGAARVAFHMAVGGGEALGKR